MSKNKKTEPRPPAKKTSEQPTASRAAERRKERQQQQRRRQMLIIGGIIGVIAILVVISIIVNSLPTEAPIPAGVVERYSDVPTSFTDQGYPIMGNSQEAVVRVVEYASFSCPPCLAFHNAVFDTVVDRVKAGEITFTYVPMGRFGNAGGVEAAKAAMCVAEQRTFWAYHDTLFNWQSLYGTQAFTLNRLRTGVEGLGLNVDDYNACMGSGRPDAVLERADRDGRSTEGFDGTPMVTVNGVELPSPVTAESLNEAIDNALRQFGIARGEITPTEEVVATETVIETEEAAVTEEPVETEEPTPES